MQGLTEDQWLSLAKSLKARPPMPWFNLNIMKDEDLRAIYQYTRHLGPGGKPAPAYVPPDKEPNPPYALFPSPPPK
jgi:mono/diheme cytochrome c family protein